MGITEGQESGQQLVVKKGQAPEDLIFQAEKPRLGVLDTE